MPASSSWSPPARRYSTGASPRSPSRNGTTSSVDLTPREACLEYLAHAFPVQLQEPFTDDEGNLMSRPVTDAEGNPVLCPGSRGCPRCLDREARGLAAGTGGAGPDPPPFRRRGRRRGHRAIAPGAAHRRFIRRAPGAAQPPGLGQPRRDRRLHGGRQTHPRLLHGRRHRAQLSRRSRAAAIHGGVSTICWSRAGGPIRRSRDWAAPIGRTRPRPPSSGQ